MLEVTAAGLDALSHDLFRADPASGRVHPPAHEQADLQHSLRSVDRAGDLASQIRDTLLGPSLGVIASWLFIRWMGCLRNDH